MAGTITDVEARISILHGPAAPDRRRLVAAVALLGLCFAPDRLLRASSFEPMGAQEQASPDEPGLHAMRGVVVSVTATELVVRRSGLRRGTMTFVMNDATDHEGTIAAGALVAVRYRIVDDALVATAVTVRPSASDVGDHMPSDEIGWLPGGGAPELTGASLVHEHAPS